MKNPPILDMCCGGRAFWFDHDDDRAVFVDNRAESHTLCDGRALEIRPDLIADFRHLPFADSTFSLVVFDPPHMARAGGGSWMRAKYGVLNKETWQADLRAGFCEAFRVLRPGGVLIFKWNETHISVSHILALTDHKPVVGHKSGKRSDTHWLTFLKDESTAKPESDPLLAYATRRIIELEALLMPEVPDTVWPAEVHFLFDQVSAASNLPAELQNKIRSHINRMKLDGLTSDAIIQQTVKLTAAMGATA